MDDDGDDDDNDDHDDDNDDDDVVNLKTASLGKGYWDLQAMVLSSLCFVMVMVVVVVVVVVSFPLHACSLYFCCEAAMINFQ